MITPTFMFGWNTQALFYYGALVNFVAWVLLGYAIVVRALYRLSKEKEITITFDKFRCSALTESGRKIMYDTLSVVPYVYSKNKIRRMKKNFMYACKSDKKIVVRDLGFLGVYYASSPMGIGPFIIPVVLLFAWSLYW